MDSESTIRPAPSEPRRLWFGVVAAAIAWFLTGIAEMFITWRACLHTEQFGNASPHSWATVASFVVSWFLIGLAATAGFVSWTNWRRLAGERQQLLQSEGRGYREFLAMIGLFISFTLGVGMVWMAIPLFIFRFCARVR